MVEEWKDIEGFEGYYQVSNYGRVKSFRKATRYGAKNEYILKNAVANHGYCQVTLYTPSKREKHTVHRLVAKAFVPNPYNLPQINHKDENVLNNRADNLEWCTPKYNNSYGTARFRMAITKGQMIDQFLPNGQFIARYACLSIASKFSGVSKRVIAAQCRGEYQVSYNYLWKYVDDESLSPQDISQEELEKRYSRRT